MSNTFRYCYGDSDPVLVPVASATVIEQGDLLALQSGAAVPASAIAWDTDEATTQGNFHDAFLGVALQTSEAGETEPIRVATGGTFDFAAVPNAYAVGDRVGPNGAGDVLADQTLKSTVAGSEVARIVRSEGAGSTTVRVRLLPLFTS